jgi:AcrR family transcriptional regulator
MVTAIKSEVAAYKRQRILQQASQMFFEKGYQTGTLELLAQRLAVSKPFIYSYFTNKSEILVEICETGIRQSLLVVEAALAKSADPARQLADIVAGVAREVIRYQDHVMVYQREMKSLAPADARRILGLRHHFDQQLAAILERGRGFGQFDIDDAAMTALWIGGLLSWIANWYRPNGRRAESEVIASLIAMVGRVVRHDLS